MLLIIIVIIIPVNKFYFGTNVNIMFNIGINIIDMIEDPNF